MALISFLTCQPVIFNWLIIRFLTGLNRQVQLVEQELMLPEHMSSLTVLMGFMLFDH